MNWGVHWSQGIMLGAVRGWMAEAGLRGPVGSFVHMIVRLLNDQTLENATGAGAPPWTWAGGRQAIDLLGKGIYAFVTGAVTDALIPSTDNGPEPRKAWNKARCFDDMSYVTGEIYGATGDKMPFEA